VRECSGMSSRRQSECCPWTNSVRMCQDARVAARSRHHTMTSQRLDKGFGGDRTLMNMGGIDSDLEELYRRRQGAFQVMLASVTGSVESARDVVQEAFAQALRDQNGFRGDGSLEAWVWRIAFRVAVGSNGSRELSLDEVPEVAFVDKSADPTFAAAVRELPPQRRMAIFLRYFADLSYAEIGETLGIAEGTVAATLSQANRQLGAALSTNEVSTNEVMA
jgi:RNA polymerase sigma-70 factor, ECF subfamily